ncbi:DUF397 domain-containing protein [Actinokineospora iranica]|uniref:DUF397 domain-containing protein n=1 Tax=Actinokineospora iranica TaxID=1271860 RepID=A0A1G6VYI6_9PSEU|nr:DUF397 domain-containing protein [Actinokineospora iranica]SDD57845.1 protein of unknown function [Actinokineospora iranica]
MATREMGQYRWHKSSYSGNQGQCVEVGFDPAQPEAIAVRDSKNPGGGALLVDAREWATFRARL